MYDEKRMIRKWNLISFYSPQMVVTIYYKILNENGSTKKKWKKQNTQTNGMY